MPERIQRKRTAGWRMPEGAIYVGRPTKWGNPQNWQEWNATARWAGQDRENRQHAADWFRQELMAGRLAITCDDVKRELHGKTLVCWCPLDQSCHADVLLEVANG